MQLLLMSLSILIFVFSDFGGSASSSSCFKPIYERYGVKKSFRKLNSLPPKEIQLAFREILKNWYQQMKKIDAPARYTKPL